MSPSGTTRDVDMKLEVLVIPVSDVDRAKKFYEGLGWRMDGDFPLDRGRLVQFTPPGSGCSIQFGTNLISAAPGSAWIMLIVSDVEAAREALVRRGVEVSQVFHCAKSYGCCFPDTGDGGRVTGLAPNRQSYFSFAAFRDPDGNEWVFQEVTARLPGRIDPAATTFASTHDLASALRRAEAVHGEYEKTLGKWDENWPDWYAGFMAREQSGEKPTA